MPPVKVVLPNGTTENQALKGFNDSIRPEIEMKLDNYFRSKEELVVFEGKLKAWIAVDYKISFRDIDALMKKLGAPMKKREIEVCTYCIRRTSVFGWWKSSFVECAPLYLGCLS